ncbi:MAG: FHA domain-containing protein [Chloroflexota bacterium]|nr:FHA domain-containing protein [Chloroflexota bacterium]
MQKFNEETALLVGQSGPLDGNSWALRVPIIVGRDPDCDIVIPDRQVSRRHARFTPSIKGILVEDLGSKNGTHWNGKPIFKAVKLQDGDIIQIALAQQFVYLSSDATVPLELSEIEFPVLHRTMEDVHSNDHLETREGRLFLDKRSRRVWIKSPDHESSTAAEELIFKDKEISPALSAFQFQLLQQLFDHQGRVVPRSELVVGVWGREQAVDVSEQALDALIRRLRGRIASVDPTHEYIITVRGHGLRLDNPPLSEN